jgi:transposase-like protein
MAHRVRYAMHAGGIGALRGDVEVDETYVGGKPRKGSGRISRPGRGTSKQPVMVLVERGGQARVRVIADVTGETLKGAIRETVHASARIISDEWAGYRGIGAEFKGGHATVNHSKGEYVRGDAYSNTAESFFALFKRGVVGAFHSVSKRHLWRYAGEFEFRWNSRHTNDYYRMAAAIAQAGGKRLQYKPPIGLL